jgi:transcriptional regulator with XRE-family HTH domain
MEESSVIPRVFFMTLGKTISELRKRKQYRQSDLAEKLGIHQTLVARWENDKTRPRRKTLEKLANALDVSVQSLLASGFERLPEALDDPEMTGLLQNLPRLNQAQREALKTFLRDMLKLSELEAVLRK